MILSAYKQSTRRKLNQKAFTKMIFALGIFFMIGCNNEKVQDSAIETSILDTSKISLYRKASDSSYIRMIGAAEFYTSEQLFDVDDSVSTKIMRDSSGRVVSILQFRKGLRIRYEEYYPSGQLKGKLPLNSSGAFEGIAKYYYEDGRVKSHGQYKNGLFAGEWMNYDPNGKYISTEIYDENGQLIRTEKP